MSDFGLPSQPAKAGEARDMGLIPGSVRCPEVGNGGSLQYSGLENPRDRGAWLAIVRVEANTQT